MNRDGMLNDLRTLIAIRSVTEDRAAARAALDWTLGRARELGFRTGITPEGDAGYAEIGSGDTVLGILAHVDVVGIGDPAKWESDPFVLTRRGGMLYGRGVEDDKGPVIQCLYAMREVLDAGVPLLKRIRLIIGTSEESEWSDIEHYRACFGTPDYGFSPDAAFPVYNVEKGYADVTLCFPAAGVEALRCGDSTNTIPSSALLRRCGGTDERFTGVSAHSSAPEKADNAILHLAAASLDFSWARFIYEQLAPDPYGIHLGLDDGTDVYRNVPVGKTVCVPTVLCLENDRVILNVNIRLRAGLSASTVYLAFARHAAAYGYTCEVQDASEAMFVDPEQTFIHEMNAAAAACGIPQGCMAASGATYCGAIPNHVGWGPVIPPDEGSAHQENESVAEEDFWRVLALYTAYLVRAAQTRE